MIRSYKMCKKYKLGNCDNLALTEEQCLFHKPNKNEIDSYIFYHKILLATGNYKRINRIYNKPFNKLIFLQFP